MMTSFMSAIVSLSMAATAPFPVSTERVGEVKAVTTLLRLSETTMSRTLPHARDLLRVDVESNATSVEGSSERGKSRTRHIERVIAIPDVGVFIEMEPHIRGQGLPEGRDGRPVIRAPMVVTDGTFLQGMQTSVASSQGSSITRANSRPEVDRSRRLLVYSPMLGGVVFGGVVELSAGGTDTSTVFKLARSATDLRELEPKFVGGIRCRIVQADLPAGRLELAIADDTSDHVLMKYDFKKEFDRGEIASYRQVLEDVTYERLPAAAGEPDGPLVMTQATWKEHTSYRDQGLRTGETTVRLWRRVEDVQTFASASDVPAIRLDGFPAGTTVHEAGAGPTGSVREVGFWDGEAVVGAGTPLVLLEADRASDELLVSREAARREGSRWPAVVMTAAVALAAAGFVVLRRGRAA